MRGSKQKRHSKSRRLLSAGQRWRGHGGIVLDSDEDRIYGWEQIDQEAEDKLKKAEQKRRDRWIETYEKSVIYLDDVFPDPLQCHKYFLNDFLSQTQSSECPLWFTLLCPFVSWRDCCNLAISLHGDSSWIHWRMLYKYEFGQLIHHDHHRTLVPPSSSSKLTSIHNAPPIRMSRAAKKRAKRKAAAARSSTKSRMKSVVDWQYEFVKQLMNQWQIKVVINNHGDFIDDHSSTLDIHGVRVGNIQGFSRFQRVIKEHRCRLIVISKSGSSRLRCTVDTLPFFQIVGLSFDESLITDRSRQLDSTNLQRMNGIRRLYPSSRTESSMNQSGRWRDIDVDNDNPSLSFRFTDLTHAGMDEHHQRSVSDCALSLRLSAHLLFPYDWDAIEQRRQIQDESRSDEKSADFDDDGISDEFFGNILVFSVDEMISSVKICAASQSANSRYAVCIVEETKTHRIHKDVVFFHQSCAWFTPVMGSDRSPLAQFIQLVTMQRGLKASMVIVNGFGRDGTMKLITSTQR